MKKPHQWKYPNCPFCPRYFNPLPLSLFPIFPFIWRRREAGTPGRGRHHQNFVRKPPPFPLRPRRRPPASEHPPPSRRRSEPPPPRILLPPHTPPRRRLLVSLALVRELCSFCFGGVGGFWCAPRPKPKSLCVLADM